MEIKQWRRLAAESMGFLLLVLLICVLCIGYGPDQWKARAQLAREENEIEQAAEEMTAADAEERQRQLELLKELQQNQNRQDSSEPEEGEQPEPDAEEEMPVIVIDAGHGGLDEGTMSVDHTFSEKDVSLQVVLYLKELLDQSGFKVYYTRLEDKEVSKAERVRMANRLHADLFVSVHCNASEPGDTTAYGMEALYTRRKKAQSDKLSSRKLAGEILKQASIYTGRRRRGIIRRENLYLMSHSKVPVTIIEIGYMTNSSDLKYLIQEKGQRRIAEGIYLGIRQSLEQ